MTVPAMGPTAEVEMGTYETSPFPRTDLACADSNGVSPRKLVPGGIRSPPISGSQSGQGAMDPENETQTTRASSNDGSVGAPSVGNSASGRPPPTAVAGPPSTIVGAGGINMYDDFEDEGAQGNGMASAASIEAHLQRFREINTVYAQDKFEYLGSVDPDVQEVPPGALPISMMEFEDVLLDEDNLFYLPTASAIPYRYDAGIDGFFSRHITGRLGRLTHILDKTNLYIKSRWVFLAFLLLLFAYRIHTARGFYLVAYACSIYLLNLVLNFLTPVVDPELESTRSRPGDDFKPFVRQLPEFKFWLDSVKALSLSTCMTLFRCFDMPVFWPVLVIYFLLLTFFTLKERIKHMIRHRYLPFSYGKKTYQRAPTVEPLAEAKGAATAKLEV
ncbi:unnamed protein product [Amoebophrya sp. A25]|nr:unnamed protein product [Amoebophrya sp. A25]|eukprot:GSA25T00004423001.1